MLVCKRYVVCLHKSHDPLVSAYIQFVLYSADSLARNRLVNVAVHVRDRLLASVRCDKFLIGMLSNIKLLVIALFVESGLTRPLNECKVFFHLGPRKLFDSSASPLKR